MAQVECVCLYCHKVFYVDPYRKDTAKYCSKECHDIGRRTGTDSICIQCGKKFYARPSLKAKGFGDHCCRACMVESRKKPEIITKCKSCGKSLKVLQSELDRGGGRYCSKECFDESQKNKISKTCKVCENMFYVKPSEVKKGKGIYCSKDCFNKDLRVSGRRGGENSPSWKGGISFEPYCPLFNNTFKDRVRSFFDYRCVVCGKTQEENNRRLDVHHVLFNKNTCCDDSPRLFVPLCRGCHGKTRWHEDYYTELFTNLIEKDHGGRCFYTMEEYRELQEFGTTDSNVTKAVKWPDNIAVKHDSIDSL